MHKVVKSCIFDDDKIQFRITLIALVIIKYNTKISFMKIIDKKLQLSLKDSLVGLKVLDQCLIENSTKKDSIRNTIQKLKAEYPNMKFKTKIENNKILVWKLSQ